MPRRALVVPRVTPIENRRVEWVEETMCEEARRSRRLLHGRRSPCGACLEVVGGRPEADVQSVEPRLLGSQHKRGLSWFGVLVSGLAVKEGEGMGWHSLTSKEKETGT